MQVYIKYMYMSGRLMGTHHKVIIDLKRICIWRGQLYYTSCLVDVCCIVYGINAEIRLIL